jgi:hypothetical protein
MGRAGQGEAARWDGHGLRPWIEAAKKRLHRNVLAIALANKLARIAWSILARGRAFEASKLQAAYHKHLSYLPVEVCERMRGNGGSGFPAHAKTGDSNRPVEADPLMRLQAR